MANSHATVNSAIIAQAALNPLQAKFPLLGQIATDFSSASVKFNQDIVTHIVTPTVAKDFVPATGYVPDDQAQVDVSVKINKHAYAGYAITLSYRRHLRGQNHRRLSSPEGLVMPLLPIDIILGESESDSPHSRRIHHIAPVMRDASLWRGRQRQHARARVLPKTSTHLSTRRVSMIAGQAFHLNALRGFQRHVSRVGTQSLGSATSSGRWGSD